MNNPWAVLALLVLGGGCRPAPAFHQEDLTNAGRGKYWDRVYSTDIFGHINPSYAAPAGPAPAQHATITYDCDYFASNGQAIHYTNIDSSTVTDRGYSDVIYNPDTFVLRDSLLTFSGHTHQILTLTPQVMVLKYEYEHRKAISVYLPSKYQTKRIKPVTYGR
jgi:hypothetical protein